MAAVQSLYTRFARLSETPALGSTAISVQGSLSLVCESSLPDLKRDGGQTQESRFWRQANLRQMRCSHVF